MAVNPAGPLSLSLYNLQTLIANSATFQNWVGAANVAEARERIYLVAVDEGSYIRPYALCALGEDWKRKKVAGGARNHFQASGSLFLLFEGAVSPAEAGNHKDAEFEFTNEVGAIITEMEILSGQSGLLAITSINFKEQAPVRSDENERETQGDFYQVIFEIEWGL